MSLATTVPSTKPLLERLTQFVGPETRGLNSLTHGLHPYPAKYIFQLPRLLIMEHTNERNRVLDPFCGSGTTLVEACALGRKSIGIDSNPVATLISRAKSTALKDEEFAYLENLQFLVDTALDRFDQIKGGRLPAIPRLTHWFQANMIKELAWLREQIQTLEQAKPQQLAYCAFSSIIVQVSNQESDTRYAAIAKNLPNGYALQRFAKKLRESIEAVRELSKIETAIRNTPVVLTADASEIGEKEITDGSIDLIVTSPPYPNSYDYYLYHKMRMYWLGFDPNEARQAEIGSRHEHSSKKAPIAVFEQRMQPVMNNMSRVLKPSKLAYFFVGDAVIAGHHIDMADVFKRLGLKAGFGHVATTEYSLGQISRSFHEKKWSVNRNKHDKMQRIVIFEGRSPRSSSYASSRFIASPKPIRSFSSLEGRVTRGAKIAIASSGDRHIHSLGRYPSKFIPELPKWAIKEYSSYGDVVCDPFGGCGTTAIEALMSGRHAISIDFSPYASLLTAAKTIRTEPTELDSEVNKLTTVLLNPERLPHASRLEFELDTFWFNAQHLLQFERIRKFITSEVREPVRTFLLAVLSTTIKNFSFLDEGQIKVKRDPKKVLSGTKGPVELLLSRLPQFVVRLKDFMKSADTLASVKVLCGSADDLISMGIRRNSIDLMVTSPPYINAMNYPMTHRYENLLLHLVPVLGLIEHQKGYFGSERVYSRDYSVLKAPQIGNLATKYLTPKLELIHGREPKRAYISAQFFESMRRSFMQVLAGLKNGGRFVLVAGTNCIRDVAIDTFEVLVMMAQELGMKLETKFHYEIIKQAFKLRRHETANLIPMDGVAVLTKP
jgi:DNA modification methylase